MSGDLDKLYWHTVNPLLKYTFDQIAGCDLFRNFRLVGGTSLSLQLGHRISVDIDMFTDDLYGSVDFGVIDKYLKQTFTFTRDISSVPIVGMGKSYLVGSDAINVVKVDFYYTDPFIQPELNMGIYRLATIEEIIAMKIDVIQRGGRKKDFWDLHELLDKYSISRMISLHKLRYPYSHEEDVIRANFVNFDRADEELDPICLKGKYWEYIKEDFVIALSQ